MHNLQKLHAQSSKVLYIIFKNSGHNSTIADIDCYVANVMFVMDCVKQILYHQFLSVYAHLHAGAESYNDIVIYSIGILFALHNVCVLVTLMKDQNIRQKFQSFVVSAMCWFFLSGYYRAALSSGVSLSLRLGLLVNLASFGNVSAQIACRNT